MSWLDRASNPANTPSDLQDLGNAAASGVANAGAGLMGAAQWVTSLASESVAPGWAPGVDKMQTWRENLNAISDDRRKDMSQEMRDMLDAPLNWSNISANPWLYLGGQIAAQGPGLAVAVASAALTADPAVGASIAMGTMTAGDGINAVYSALDKIPDADLQKQSTLYAGFRSEMGEAQARAQLRKATIGAAPAVLAIIGAAAGAVGGAGQLGRALTGSTAGQVIGLEGKNFLQRAALGAAVGGAAGGVQSGATDVAEQVSLARAGVKNFDQNELVGAVLQGGAMGAAMGGLADAFGGAHKAEGVKPGATEVVEPGELTADEKLAMGAAVPPPKVTTEVTPPTPQPVETPPVEPRSNVPGPVQSPAPVPEPAQQAPVAGPGPVADAGTPRPTVAPEPAPVAEPAKAPAPAAPVVEQPQAPVAPEAKPVATQPVVKAPPSHDAVFSAASKTATIAKAVQKISGITGAPVEQVQAALKSQTVGKDVAGIRDTAKTWLANAKPLDDTAGAKHRGPAERQVRADANSTAQRITDRFGPNPETEKDAAGAANTPGVKEARVALANRVGKMVDAANEEIVKPLIEQKVEFPSRFKDNTDKSADWNEHVLLLAEAQRLYRKINNKSASTADYQRFLSREHALRGGDAAGVKSERRSEGDQAFRKGVVSTTGDVADTAKSEPEAKIATDVPVTTKVPKSAKKPIAEGKTGPASAVRKVALTAEEKAKYEKPANKNGSWKSKTWDDVRAATSPAIKAKEHAVVEADARLERLQHAARGKKLTDENIDAFAAPAKAAAQAHLDLLQEKLDASLPPGYTTEQHNFYSSRQADGHPDRGDSLKLTVHDPEGGVVGGFGPRDLMPALSPNEGHSIHQLLRTGSAPEAFAAAHSAGMAASKGEAVSPKINGKVVGKAKVEEIKAKAAEKQATVKQRVAKAAKQVETKPTPAQAEAGNYAKGHVSIHGLDIAIENPRGSTRSGVGPDGKPWSVKMPDHYGYIKRTAGADGDHVDVYVGPHPESEHVFLVEQRNAETGKFDEHKAMLGYDNAAHAMSAYERAFSDGKAADRFGSIKPMSVDEFKTWLKEGDTTKPTDEFKATEKHLASEREKISVAQTREGTTPTPYVRARNAVANWLNGLSDREYHDLEAAHFARPLEETDGQSIPQMLDNADSPAELGKIYRDLKTLHEQAHPVTSEVPVPPRMNDTFTRSQEQTPFEELAGIRRAHTAEQAAKASYDEAISTSKKTLAYVRAVGTRVDAGGVLDHAVDMYRQAAIREAAQNVARRELNSPFDEPTQHQALGAAMVRNVVTRLKALAGDVPVYVLKDKDFYAYRPEHTLAYYDGISHHIAVPESEFNNGFRGAHTMVHEMVHAAFLTAMDKNQIARGLVTDLMNEVLSAPEADYLTSHPHTNYSFTNPDEFIAEALSNPQLQEALAGIPVSNEMATRLGLAHNMGTLWDAVVSMVRKVLGLPAQSHTVLDAMLRISDALDADVSNSPTGTARPFSAEQVSRLAREAVRKANGGHSGIEPANLTTDAIGKTLSDVKDAVESSITGKGRVQQMAGPMALKLRTFDQIAAVSKRYFKGNPVRAAFNAVEGMRVAAMKVMQSFEPEIMAIHKMADKYAGPVFDDFAALMHDSTMAGVFPNEDLLATANDHIPKTGHTGEWQRAQHAELKAKFDALPEDLKNTYVNAVNFFRDKQNQLALGTMQNRILKALGVEDKGMAARLFSGTETDADKKALGPAYDVVKQAGELSKIDGPYFPLMRRGTHVVTGEHAVADPTQASYQGRSSDGAYIFGNKDDAGKFAAKDENGKTRALRPTIKTVYVDASGSQFGREADGSEVRLTAKDPNAVPQYRVSIQNKHVEFVDGLRAAEKLHYDLEQAGLKNVDHQERMIEPGRGRGDMLSTEAKQVMKVIEQRDAYKGMSDSQKFEVQQALQELSLRFLGSTRIQSRALPRRYVAGASRDVVRNTYEYAQSVANYLGKLEHAPALEKAMSAMQDEVRNDYTKDTSVGKSAIYNEVLRRVTTFTPIAGDTDKFSAVTKRFMALSFLDKLFSPSHSVINAMQPAMLSVPTIGGRHGVARTFAAFSKAYNDIGALKTAMHGLQKTVEHATKPSTADLATFVEDIMGRVKNPGERAMLQFLVDHGTIDPDAGFEVNRMISSSSGVGGALDTGINYLDGIARQMPRAVETINRAVTGLAAYRLELARGGDHEAAVAYAQEVTNLTQGIYSSSNAAPIFNNPLLRLSLQFKKYGQLVYGLIGHHIGKAMANAEPGDRVEALKALGTMAALHIAIAGTLGLPTEPFKWLMLGANFAGLTKYKWADVENWERQVLAHVAGKQVGEVLARGVTRALPGGLAFDLSGRAGLNDLMSFGEPQSNSPQDLASYFGTLIMGAPGSLALDYIKAAQKVSAGDFVGAAQLMIPMKAAADGVAAYQKMTSGKVNKYGNQTMQPYSLQEAMVRTFGFTPAREAETGDAQANFYNVTERNKAEVQGYQQQWAAATPGQRMHLWATIERYNQTANAGNKLTRAQLDSFARNKAAGVASGKVSNGLQVNNKTRSVLDANSAVYAQ